MERHAAIRRFNDKDSGLQILPSGLRIGSYGRNLRYACHYGIVLQMHWNLHIVFQAIYRPYRSDQWLTVKSVILKVKDSIHDYIKDCAQHKFAPQMAAEGSFYNGIRGELLLVVVYKLLRDRFGAEFSRAV